jgi:hypothetical protein
MARVVMGQYLALSVSAQQSWKNYGTTPTRDTSPCFCRFLYTCGARLSLGLIVFFVSHVIDDLSFPSSAWSCCCQQWHTFYYVSICGGKYRFYSRIHTLKSWQLRPYLESITFFWKSALWRIRCLSNLRCLAIMITSNSLASLWTISLYSWIDVFTWSKECYSK